MEKGKGAWEGNQEVAREAAEKQWRKTWPRNQGRRELRSRKWGTNTAKKQLNSKMPTGFWSPGSYQ